MSGVIAGPNQVREALAAGRQMEAVLVSAGARSAAVRQTVAVARRLGVPVKQVSNERLDALCRGLPHQGILALVAAHAYVAVGEILRRPPARGEPALLLVLDGIQDPRNLGAVIRTAEAAGAHGIIVPQRRAVGLTAAVGRASAGAIEHVPVARVVNLSRTLEKLKEEGIWVVGADPGGASLYFEADFTVPVALVLGSEGKGISRLAREHCDLLVRIPMGGKVSSLNAAVAAGVVLYEVVRQRRAKAAR